MAPTRMKNCNVVHESQILSTIWVCTNDMDESKVILTTATKLLTFKGLSDGK